MAQQLQEFNCKIEHEAAKKVYWNMQESLINYGEKKWKNYGTEIYLQMQQSLSLRVIGVIVIYVSKWPEVIAIPNQVAQTFSEALMII